MKKAVKIPIIVVCSIVGGVAAILLLMSIFMTAGSHIKFKEFFSIKENVAKNPGLWHDYIPQGVTFNTDENYYATCGYMKDGSASRVYTITDKNKVCCYKLTSLGNDYCGHTGGLQYLNGNFYLASEGEGVFKFSSNFDKNGNSIEIGEATKVNNNSSFIFSDGSALYVGEFARVPAYPCVHEVTFNDITHTAILSKYADDSFSKPLVVYSIPDEVQGFGILSNGAMVVSRSWGIDFACYDVYTATEVVNTGMQYDGAPLLFFTEPKINIPSIFFSEDIDVVDDKVLSMTEAAGNKYFIGKFIFDYKLYTLDINRLINK